MASTDGFYPGSRWWKFDFHTHTPASCDTPWYKKNLALSPQDWLLKFMAAGLDCVAITDHNSGDWIDRLKSAYTELKQQADQARQPTGFRELTLFPGIEISVHDGVHILALFDTQATGSDIDTLLGRLDYRDTKGDSDGVTRKNITEAIEIIMDSGAIPIPAHADGDKKGLLACQLDSQKSQIDANTLRQALAVEGLLAVEWCDTNAPWPQCVAQEASRLARVLGSDCHSFQGTAIPGSRFTWVKMTRPTLEGLRLALLDGNGFSLHCSNEGIFDPLRIPAHLIRSIGVEQVYCLGRGQPAELSFSPYFNAIIGGRGTGKSTVVHALRLAMRRDAELNSLGLEIEPRKRFDQFCKIATGRPDNNQDKGALRQNTEICVEWQDGEERFKLRWRADGQGTVVQEWDGREWRDSNSQSVNAARFPIRIFSQGQIAAMADTGRQSVLSIIDEAANIEPLQQQYSDARRTFFAQRAKLRELEGKLANKPEVERKLQDTERKLATFSQTDHAAVLRTFAQAQHQRREVEGLLSQLGDGATAIERLAEQLMLDDWPEHYFGTQDADLLAWRQAANQSIEQARANLHQQAMALRVVIANLAADERLEAWRSRAQTAEQAHQQLQQQMADQGVSDPQAFARLTQERQHLDAQRKALEQMQADHTDVLKQLAAQHQLITQRRQAITLARQSFLERILVNNAYVRIAVAAFGFEDWQYERELRQLIEVNDERFAEDILRIENSQPVSGMAYDLARTEVQKIPAIEAVREKLLTVSDSLGGRLRNYLKRKYEKPEFADHILAWFPEDDLRIDYQRSGEWNPIASGSQGQRSAALLAFLLAFGEEPLVLDQPEDDLDNHLIYDLIVHQIRENKRRRQLIVVTHNPNVVVNGDAELVHVMDFGRGQCYVKQSGALQELDVREEVCRVMEGGHEAFERRWKRLGREV